MNNGQRLRKKADSILAKFNKTDKSEYEFAKLAEQYSTDSASTSSGSNDSFGGLYESVTLGQMVRILKSGQLTIHVNTVIQEL